MGGVGCLSIAFLSSADSWSFMASTRGFIARRRGSASRRVAFACRWPQPGCFVLELRRGHRFVSWLGIVVPLFEIIAIFNLQLLSQRCNGVGGVHDRPARRAGRVDA